MTEIKIKIKFNKGEEKIKELDILSDMKIEELRLIIEEEFKIPSYKQNLIFKGKMLQNEKKIEDYNISNDDTILLFEKYGEEKEKVGLNKVRGQSGIGAPGQINYDLLKQPMGFGGDINQLIEAMKIPEIAGQLDSLFDDPNIINAMMENPQFKALAEINPGIKDLMTNKEFMKNMLSPENLEFMKKIQEGNLNPSNPPPNFMNNFGNNNFGFNMFNPMMMGRPNFFPQGNQNQILTPEQLKDKYKNEIKTIKDMGFDNEEKIINALQKTNGNINASIERLINFNGNKKIYNIRISKIKIIFKIYNPNKII